MSTHISQATETKNRKTMEGGHLHIKIQMIFIYLYLQRKASIMKINTLSEKNRSRVQSQPEVMIHPRYTVSNCILSSCMD